MTHPALIERITRSLAYMLRHQPDEFDLEVDEYGFADVGEVIRALNERLGESVSEDDVRDAVGSGDRQRYEVVSGRIRALYGHSIEVQPGEPSRPPEMLYIGVSRSDAERARRYGLRPGRRRFLHLALTPDDALETAQRTAREHEVLTVRALDAWEEGINFYDRISLFLSDPIPTQFLEAPSRPAREEVRSGGGRRGPVRHAREEIVYAPEGDAPAFSPAEGEGIDEDAPFDGAGPEGATDEGPGFEPGAGAPEGGAGDPQRRRRRRRGRRGRGRLEGGPVGAPADTGFRAHPEGGAQEGWSEDAPARYEDPPREGAFPGDARRSDAPRAPYGRELERAPERESPAYPDARGRPPEPRREGRPQHERAPAYGAHERGPARGPEHGPARGPREERRPPDRPRHEGRGPDRPREDRGQFERGAPPERPRYPAQDRPYEGERRGPPAAQPRRESGGDRPPMRRPDEIPRPRREDDRSGEGGSQGGGFGLGIHEAERSAQRPAQSPRPPPPPPPRPAPRREEPPPRDEGGGFGAGLD